MKAIKIDEFGNMSEVDTRYVSNVITKSSFDYVVLECYDLHDDGNNGNTVKLNIIGQLSDYFNFNRYEFQSCYPRGTVFVVLYNPAIEDYSNISISDFVDFYEEIEDMDTTLIQDELLNTSDIDDYDTTDPFLQDDRED